MAKTVSDHVLDRVQEWGVRRVCPGAPACRATPSAWDEALAADRPFVIDAVVDPDVPPLPPHISFEQVQSMTAALLKGDPDLRGVLRQSLLEKLREYVR